LDGCGGQRDIQVGKRTFAKPGLGQPQGKLNKDPFFCVLQLWSELFNHSIRTWNEMNPNATRKRLPMLLENCHDGMEPRPPAGSADSSDWGAKGITPHYDDKGELWCPFHMYRSGGDNRPTWGSVLAHLNNTVAFALGNLSVPGCWAYPVRTINAYCGP